MRVAAVVAVVATASLAWARCRPDAELVARYESAGPHPVAHTTLTFVDATRPTPANGGAAAAPTRTLVTEVWFPADAAGAPQPLVVHSHGFSGSRTSQAWLAAHLASHGVVVAAPDFPLTNGGAAGGPTLDDIEHQPGDVAVVIDHLLAVSATPGSPLHRAVDGERIGASGVSLGGLTTLLATYHRDLRDPRIRAAMPIAAPGCFLTRRFFRASRAPILLLYGTNDLIVPHDEHGRHVFRAARGPRALVSLTDGTHTGFSAFATLLPEEGEHYDKIACSLLVAALEGALADPADTPYRDVATPGAGVSVTGRGCSPACPAGTTAAAPDRMMPPRRQHAITKAVAAAFFGARLRDDPAARCVLRRGIAAAFADVRVRADE